MKYITTRTTIVPIPWRQIKTKTIKKPKKCDLPEPRPRRRIIDCPVLSATHLTKHARLNPLFHDTYTDNIYRHRLIQRTAANNAHRNPQTTLIELPEPVAPWLPTQGTCALSASPTNDQQVGKSCMDEEKSAESSAGNVSDFLWGTNTGVTKTEWWLGLSSRTTNAQ